MAREGDSYATGSSDHERTRLARQAVAFGPATECLLRAAGIRLGARVLDIGCGASDGALTLTAAHDHGWSRCRKAGPTGMYQTSS
jgi:cyclopropane fatty-acyl-phospholipid synthase-like methyltransferase